MSRAVRLAKGAAALVVLVVLLAGIPLALWHFVGWPLPHHVPTAAQVGRALDRQAIPAQALVDALAVVVWLAWASLLVSVALEIPATLRGRAARRLPVAGVLQPVAGRLVAAVVVAGLALTPRPGHAPAAAPLASRLPPLAGRPPAALVLATATATATAPAPSPAVPLRPASLSATPAPAEATGGGGSAPRVYVVQRGDTLWGIAERELGDPLAWSQIYRLNEGRPQPGGVTLTDPHWIDPGWTLLLPAAAAPPATPPPPPGPAVPTPIPPPTATTVPPATVLPSTGPPSTGPPRTTTPPANGHRPQGGIGTAPQPPAAVPAGPVQLPSGSVVAGSFAAGVLSALAAGRLRRRHAYRYHPPRPGRDLTPPPLRPTLAHLVRSRDEARDVAGEQVAGDGSGTGFAGTGPASGRDPGQVEIARRGEETIEIAVTDLSGTALVGPASTDVTRALLAGFLVGAGQGMAEVLLAGETAGRLLAETRQACALRRLVSSESAARAVEAERIARTRRLAAAGAPDAARFRCDNPENPLPTLLVLADPPPADSAGRWGALAAAGGRLGIAIVYLGDTPAAAGTLATDERRRVTAVPDHLADRLRGAELYGLDIAEATELLDAVTGALEGPGTGAPGAVGETGESSDSDGADDAERAREDHGQPWPEPARIGAPEERPIQVQLFGHMAVAVDSKPVTDGLRSRAKMLLAWYLCRPEGATSEEAVDALWPDTAPDGVLRQFWRAFGDLRSRLRDAGGDGLDVLVKAGDHYQPAVAEIACDLWDFQAALGDAARASDDEATRVALRRAADAYKGELLQGADWLWVEPVRADLYRRALDAHLRLAELERAAGCPDAARAVLERAIELDRYAEEPYRRLMALHGAHGRTDAVRATWKLLNHRMGELDVEVDAASARLYRTLTAEVGERTGPLRLRA